jgi:hypothetical protein
MKCETDAFSGDVESKNGKTVDHGDVHRQTVPDLGRRLKTHGDRQLTGELGEQTAARKTPIRDRAAQANPLSEVGYLPPSLPPRERLVTQLSRITLIAIDYVTCLCLCFSCHFALCV